MVAFDPGKIVHEVVHRCGALRRSSETQRAEDEAERIEILCRVSPWSVKAARVKPYEARLTTEFEIVHECPTATPHGWFHNVKAGVSGKHWMLSGSFGLQSGEP